MNATRPQPVVGLRSVICYLLLILVSLGSHSLALDTFLPVSLALFHLQACELPKGKVLLSPFHVPDLQTTYISVTS